MYIDNKLESLNQDEQRPQNGDINHEASFAELLEQYDPAPLQQGQYIEGEILRIDKNVILADVDAKRTAVIPPQDLERLEEDELAKLSVGDEVTLYVLRTPEGDEDLLVSLNKGLEQKDWLNAKEYMENEELLNLEVVGFNKGGLMVAFEHLRGFVPTSHVPQLQNIYNQSQLASIKTGLVGEELPLKVIEVDRERRRLVMSGKKAQKEVRQQRLLELKLKVGETITGTIINLVHFGAFVDLDGVEGLIHISEIAWQKVEKPSDYLSPSEVVEVVIQSVDIEQERVGLSRKALLPSPWDSFAQTHTAGSLIEGVVTSVVDFGAFVTVAEGIEGLIHVSEIVGTQDFAPQDVLMPGDTLLLRILKIQPEKQRLSLSQRQVSHNEEMEWIWQKEQAATLSEDEEE